MVTAETDREADGALWSVLSRALLFMHRTRQSLSALTPLSFASALCCFSLAAVRFAAAGYMNVALEQTEEYVDGQLKAKYGDSFIRGNNILYISTQKRKAKPAA